MKKLSALIILILISCTSVKTSSLSLVGKWKCYHKELQDGTTKSTDLFSGKEFDYSCKKLIIELKSNLTGTESIDEQSFKYDFKDSILTPGSRLYIVESLSEKELILRDHKPDGLSFSIFRHKLERIE